MKLEYIMLAKGSAVDQDTNSISIFDVIEELQVGIQNPTQESHPKLIQAQVLFVLAREGHETGVLDEEHQIVATGPAGNEVFRLVGIPVHFESFHDRARVRITANFQVGNSGVYTFRVLKGSSLVVGEYSFRLKYIIQP